jgi:serine protease Do
MLTRLGTLTLALLALGPARAPANDSYAKVCEEVNSKMVKIFGAGGFSRLNNYGTGIIVSPDGHILTVANQLLDTADLVVHLYDGRRMKAEVMVLEPELDAALIRIKVEGVKPGQPTGLDLPFFDFAAAAKQPLAQPGDWVIAFTNMFEIALRDEPLTAQRGTVAAFTKLHGRLGAFEFPYTGDVYVVDSVTNNPGSPGGALTTREGKLIGVIGREVHNTQTDTRLNYAIPVGAKIEVKVRVKEKDKEEERTVTLSLPEFVARGMKGEYKPIKREKPPPGQGGYHGIVFVPNVLSRTPAYVEDVLPGSPAAKAGIKPDDLISFVDGEPVVSIQMFSEYIRERTRPGTTIRLEVRRGEALQTIEMTLTPHPARPAPAPMPPEKK